MKEEKKIINCSYNNINLKHKNFVLVYIKQKYIYILTLKIYEKGNDILIKLK